MSRVGKYPVAIPADVVVAIAGRTLPSRDEPESREIIERYRNTPAKLPEHLVLSHDKSCNISCPSCRSSVPLIRSQHQFHQIVVRP